MCGDFSPIVLAGAPVGSGLTVLQNFAYFKFPSLCVFTHTHTHTRAHTHTDLHRTRLTHTDLKPENVLFVSSEYDIYYDARKVRGPSSEL